MKVEDFNRDFENLIKLKYDEKKNIDAEILKMIIAKALIELMNGTIEFINEENKGTQYIIKIKQKITSENVLGNIKEKIQLDNSIRTQIIDLTNKNALIIDDKKINLMLLKTLLNKNNINIETIEKNNELNENIIDKKYDLIFVNYESETINSNDIINKLKISKSKDAPIVSLVFAHKSSQILSSLGVGFIPDNCSSISDGDILSKSLHNFKTTSSSILCI